jgi:CO dehydrogenase/acetyl-CoA synthase gamma subunit (corrinoid Fe-S protein)
LEVLLDDRLRDLCGSEGEDVSVVGGTLTGGKVFVEEAELSGTDVQLCDRVVPGEVEAVAKKGDIIDACGSVIMCEKLRKSMPMLLDSRFSGVNQSADIGA